MQRSTIYTIGHSTHELSYFLELLSFFKITCIVDVRSIAASKHNPQYNKLALQEFLKSNGISYLHFAEEFGARQTNPLLLDDEGKVDFEKVRNSWHFQNGIDRLNQGVLKGFTIALMCSESNPFECHRFSMISVELQKRQFEVMHIIKNKTLKSNLELEQQMFQRFESLFPKTDMFTTPLPESDKSKLAYRMLNKEIAYSPNKKNVVSTI